ncbi:hypothetical protein FBU30_006195 [Linnemannia zychae]|nr:hypothetical protein FBU30_006195 [Linnemannia zychae]
MYRYFVRWKGYAPEHNSWIPFQNFDDTQISRTKQKLLLMVIHYAPAIQISEINVHVAPPDTTINAVMSSSIPTSSLAESDENTDDEQWNSVETAFDEPVVDQSKDNQSSLQEFSDDEPRLKRKILFRGFINGSQEDIELLSAIEQYTPYDAQYGQKKETWENVYNYLKGLDKDRLVKGFAARYITLSEDACKKRWKAHQNLVKQYETTLKTATGISPPSSAHMERMRRVVDTSDSDAIARHMEAESASRRRIEGALEKLTAAIEHGQQANRNTFQKLTAAIEDGKQRRGLE